MKLSKDLQKISNQYNNIIKSKNKIQPISEKECVLIFASKLLTEINNKKHILIKVTRNSSHSKEQDRNFIFIGSEFKGCISSSEHRNLKDCLETLNINFDQVTSLEDVEHTVNDHYKHYRYLSAFPKCSDKFTSISYRDHYYLVSKTKDSFEIQFLKTDKLR